MNVRNLILAIVVLAFTAVVCFLDPVLLWILGVAPLLWIGLPASVAAGILWIAAIRTGRSRRPAVVILLVVAAFGCFVGLAISANHFVQQRAVAAAREYPAQVAPVLDAYRLAHGSYPTSLDQLPAKPDVPRLLRSASTYRSDGSAYSFSFGDQGGLFDTWQYDSKIQTWELSEGR